MVVINKNIQNQKGVTMLSQEQIEKMESAQKGIQKGLEPILPDVKEFMKEFNNMEREIEKKHKIIENRLKNGARKTDSHFI